MDDGSTELKVDIGIDITEFQEAVDFDLLSVVGRRHEKYYPCCDFPAIDITYDVAIRRKKLFYTVNLMIPCIGIAMLASFVFYMPNESRNKITLCISVLVSLTVFFLLLVRLVIEVKRICLQIEIIPPTSTAVPLIGKYLLFTMVMVTLSVVLTIIIVNIHHQGNRPMPGFIRRFFIDFLGNYILIYKRPSEIGRKLKKVCFL
jgi:nicotinic acetylcholine receptor